MHPNAFTKAVFSLVTEMIAKDFKVVNGYLRQICLGGSETGNWNTER